jgi:16S rRNA (guanine966-N2)-methyltransferase
MRIIAGQYKGRKLFAPEDRAIRPSSASMREALFNILMHGEFGGEQVIDARIADICSGTGALGLEGLSRGAAQAIFIDHDRQAITLAKKNATHLGAMDQCEFHCANACNLPTTNTPYDLIITDPPYKTNILPEIFNSARKAGWLKAGTIFAAELPRQADIPELENTQCLRTKQHGKAALILWRVE